MLWFIPDHLKIKKMCKYTAKKLPLVIRYVPHWYKNQEMYDKGNLKKVER